MALPKQAAKVHVDTAAVSLEQSMRALGSMALKFQGLIVIGADRLESTVANQ